MPTCLEPSFSLRITSYSLPTEYDNVEICQLKANIVQVPHPLFPTFELRVQTDGEITPKEAVIAACKDLVTELASFDREFKREYELRKMVGQEGGL